MAEVETASNLSPAEAMQALGGLVTGAHYSRATKTEEHNAVFRLARSITEDSGVCDLLKKWEVEDQEMRRRHPGGRPPELDYVTVVSVYLAHALMRRPLLHRHVADVFASMTKKQLAIVGAPAHTSSPDAVFYKLYRRFQAVDALISPTPGPRRHALTKVEVQHVLAERKKREPELAKKQERCELFLNTLIAASVRVLPRAIRRHTSGIYAVDATHIPLPGRPRSQRSRFDATIYDGGWYVRDTGDGEGHDGTSGYTQRRGGKYVWALEVELISRGAESYSSPASPLLIHAMNVHKPASHPAQSAANAIKLMPTLYPDQSLRYLVGDRLYLPNGKPDVFQGPMRHLGFKLLMDYPRDQLGIQDQFGGALMVDGSWYCPAMPSDLVQATIQHNQGLIDDAALATRIEGRRAFLLQPKEQPRPAKGGTLPAQKYRCPAAGPSPTLRCPLKPSRRGNPAKSVLAPMLPHHPDTVCTNKESITIPGEAGLKTRQDLPYLTAEWKAHYQGARSKIESVNNKVKSAAHEGFGPASSRQSRSATAHAIFAALSVVAANCTRAFTFLKTYLTPEAAQEKHTTRSSAPRLATTNGTPRHRRGPP